MKNQRHVGRTLMVAFLAPGIASTASADIIELQPGSGPPSQVQDAIDAADDGDVIRLGAGTWIWGIDYEQLDLGGKAITLEGEGDTVISLALKSEYTPAILVQRVGFIA